MGSELPAILLLDGRDLTRVYQLKLRKMKSMGFPFDYQLPDEAPSHLL